LGFQGWLWHLLRDEDGVAEVGVEAIGELLEARSDLVEVDGLMPPVALDHIRGERRAASGTRGEEGRAATAGVRGGVSGGGEAGG